MSRLEVRDAVVRFGDRVAVDGVSLTVAAGEWVTVIGPNGAGKSTLLRAVAGLVAHEGSILVGGSEAAGADRRRHARRVAYVPQQPQRPDGMSVFDYVLLGRTPHLGWLGGESRRDVATAREAVALLGLGDVVKRDVATLSGGEAQRTVLARAIAQEADLVLLDEPTTALDVGHQQDVLRLIDELRSARGLTVVATMHDLTLAGQYADRLVLLAGGKVRAEGAPRDVLTTDMIRRHYHAETRVLTEPDGSVVVAPVKSAAQGVIR